MFPIGNGWLGGDAAYSIPINGDQILWLFGDTFTDLNHTGHRSFPLMVGNSVGVSTRSQTGWVMQYFYGSDEARNPRAFFVSQKPGIRFWPRHGFYWRGETHVFLSEVEHTAPGPYGFEITGTQEAVFDVKSIKNNSPVQYREIHTPKNFLIASAITESRGLQYVFSTLDEYGRLGRRPVFLSRYDGRRWEYFSKTRQWKRGLYEKDALEAVADGANEMSVTYSESTKRWLMVYSDKDIISGQIFVRQAKELTGPWSEPKVLYQVPEIVGSERTPYAFTYAAKLHSELNKDNKTLALTYVVNLDEDSSDRKRYEDSSLWRIVKPENYRFYVPVLTYVPIPTP